MRFHAFVLINVCPTSPPWNASKSIRIFENDWLAGRDVNSCFSGSRVRSGVEVGGEDEM